MNILLLFPNNAAFLFSIKYTFIAQHLSLLLGPIRFKCSALFKGKTSLRSKSSNLIFSEQLRTTTETTKQIQKIKKKRRGEDEKTTPIVNGLRTIFIQHLHSHLHWLCMTLCNFNHNTRTHRARKRDFLLWIFHQHNYYIRLGINYGLGHGPTPPPPYTQSFPPHPSAFLFFSPLLTYYFLLFFTVNC